MTVSTNTLNPRRANAVDWALCEDYLHRNGRKFNGALSTIKRLELVVHGDGYGKMSRDEIIDADLVWDWSHVRDSSDEAIHAMAEAIRRTYSL